MTLKMPAIGFNLGSKASFDQKKLRNSFGQFKTGVIIATSSQQSFLNRAKEFIAKTDFSSATFKQLSAKISGKIPNKIAGKISSKITSAASDFGSKGGKMQIFKSLDLFIKSQIFDRELVEKFKKLFSKQLSGMTINSFSSVSLNPPLVSFCIDNRSGNLSAFKKNKFFALNILSQEQQFLANAFAKPANSAKWQAAPFAISKFGNPVFENSLAIIECKRNRIIKMGDHHILFGEVVGFYTKDESENDRALGYWRGRYE